MSKKPKITYCPPQLDPHDSKLPFQSWQADNDLPKLTSLYQQLAESYREDRGSVKASLSKRMLSLREKVKNLIGGKS